MPADKQPVVMVADDHIGLAHALTLLLSRSYVTRPPANSILQLRASLSEWIDPSEGSSQGHLAVLLDLEFPDGENGLEALPGLRSGFPSVRFIIHSAHANPVLARTALLAGADGFVAKACGLTELRQAIGSAFADHPSVFLGADFEPDVGVDSAIYPDQPLPPALRRVLLCLQAGRRRREIADLLGISLSAVEADITRLRRSFGAPGRKPIDWRRCRER